MDTLAEVADQAAEAVRTLIHAVPGELRHPAEVYDIVGGLETMAHRLPQLFGQLSAWLEREHQAGRVAHDSGTTGDAAEAVDGVVDALRRASGDAEVLAEALSTAHSSAAALKRA